MRFIKFMKSNLSIFLVFLLLHTFAKSDDGNLKPPVFNNYNQIYDDINKPDFPEKHVRDSILVKKPIDARMASILNRSGRFQTNAEDYLTVANVIIEYEFSSVSSIKEALLASTGLLDKIKKATKNKYDRFYSNLKCLSETDNPTIIITSAGILKNLSGSNEKFIAIFEKYSRGINKENWDLDGTSLFGYGDAYKDYLAEGFKIDEIRECAINEIRVDAFRTLINLDEKIALETADSILNKEIIKTQVSERLSYDYHDLRAAIIRIMDRKSKKK